MKFEWWAVWMMSGEMRGARCEAPSMKQKQACTTTSANFSLSVRESMNRGQRSQCR